MTEAQKKIGEERTQKLSKILTNTFRDNEMTRDEAVIILLSLRKKLEKMEEEKGHGKRI